MKILEIDVQIREPPLYSECGIRYSKPGEILGGNVFVIDDITTHRQTFVTCGQKLKESGANKVFAAALAHSELTSEWQIWIRPSSWDWTV